ncbi:MAG: AAA family ATPase [Pontibacterium sp.]
MSVYLLSDFLSPTSGITLSDQTSHLLPQSDANALWAAYAAGRPLLIKGEPGTGKSQTAKAIAKHLGWVFVEEVINYHTELNDLFYSFDAVQRLADAQVNNAISSPKPEQAEQAEKPEKLKSTPAIDNLSPEHYLSPGPLWWAFNYSSAKTQHDKVSCQHRPKPSNSEDKCKGVVLLLDEIDKAQPELANGLLGALGNREFVVPYLNQPIKVAPNANLLVVITSNDERELPQAFIRRCLVHTLHMESSPALGKSGQELRYEWLIERAKSHFGGDVADEVYLQAAQTLWKDREAVRGNGYKPGLAEYIDLLRVLASLDKHEQLSTMRDISQYVLRKDS